MTILVENSTLREAFRRGDKAALTQVYFAYAEQLFAMLSNGFAIQSAGKRMMFNGYREPWQLEGAVQEIFSRAFTANARAAYDGLRPYKNYLFTIARNYVVDAFRRGDKSFVVMDTVAEDGQGVVSSHAPKGPPSPEKSIENRQLREQVAHFINGLDSSETSLFQCRFVDRLSVERSAVHLGRSEYWVKRTEKKLKKRFFHFMKDRGYFVGFEYRDPGASQALSVLLLTVPYLGGQ